LFKIYWNIEQVHYPHASKQSCQSMWLEIDQAQQPFCFSFTNWYWILQWSILLWMMHNNSSFDWMDFAFQLGENYLYEYWCFLCLWVSICVPCHWHFFSNFKILFFLRLLNYAFGKGWTFISNIHIEMMFPFNQLIIY
jgi:hypothetical protein